MSKKRKNKRVSKRGHEKQNVIRYREKLKRELYRIDEDGKRINPPAPINTFSAEWMAKQLAEIGGKPPVDHSLTPPPDNVRSIFKPKFVAVSGNEAEERNDPPDKGKRLEFDSPPSTVRNPFIKPAVAGVTIASGNRRIRMRQGVGRPAYNSKILAPSLTPIWVFTKGHFKPIEKPVVYTTAPQKLEYMQQWPFVRPIKDPPKQLSPSWDWHRKAANDNAVQVRHTSSIPWASKMKAHVMWFINHIEVDYWPDDVLKFATWKPGGYVPNTGAINKAAAYVESSADMLNSLYEGAERSHRKIDSDLCDARSENNLLRQELEATQKERNHLEYALAQATGDSTSAEEILRDDNIIKAKPPITDDADELLAQFKVFKAFVECDGLEHAFARYGLGDPRLGDVIRDHADMRCRERVDAVEGRKYAKNLSKLMYKLPEWILQERIKWWNNEYPKLRRAECRKRRNVPGSVATETCALAAMSRRAQSEIFSSIYYSRLGFDERAAVRSNAMAGALIEMIKPFPARYNNPKLVEDDTRTECAVNTHKAAKYAAWWRENADRAEMMYQHKVHPGRVLAVKAYNKLIDIGNIEINPAERKRKAEKLQRMRQKQHELDEMRESRKEAKLKRKQEKQLRAHIRKLQSLAH